MSLGVMAIGAHQAQRTPGCLFFIKRELARATNLSNLSNLATGSD